MESSIVESKSLRNERDASSWTEEMYTLKVFLTLFLWVRNILINRLYFSEPFYIYQKKKTE